MEAEAGIALTLLGGRGGTARLVTRGGAGAGQEVRPVRLYWELLAVLVQESRSVSCSSCVCEKVLTSWRASLKPGQRSQRLPPSRPPPRRSWKGGSRREISGDVWSGAERGGAGEDSPVRVSAPPMNLATLQKTNAEMSNRKQVLQNFLLRPAELLQDQLPAIKGVRVCLCVCGRGCSADSRWLRNRWREPRP